MEQISKEREREAFEKWAAEEVRADRLPLERHEENGAYKDTRTYTAWYAWKARAERPTESGWELFRQAMEGIFNLQGPCDLNGKTDILREVLPRIICAAPEFAVTTDETYYPSVAYFKDFNEGEHERERLIGQLTMSGETGATATVCLILRQFTIPQLVKEQTP